MENQTEKPKKIPYGKQNWEDMRLQNCYYVDKTHYIPEIEAANDFFFFIRPRRFGKSLLINMLRQYYDASKEHLFDRLFGGLWIGDHPTDNRNKYLVLYLNFSMISGGIKNFEDSMNNYCRQEMESFCRRYKDVLPTLSLEGLDKQKTANGMLSHINIMAREAGQSIYLFIDEYDHFTNDILADPDTENAYKAQTHGTGTMREFFNHIKGSADSSIKRAFITGVSPVTMDDLTSGFNIGSNYTTDPVFNGMVGFTENEVRTMLDYYRQYHSFRHTTDELLDIMRPWYDNYCFSKDCIDDPTMYNSNMVWYFIDNYIRRKGKVPDNMVDVNIRTDYNKLRMLIRKDRGFEHDASIIQHIVETGGITAELKDYFPSETITDPDNFVSLLYYFGMLTIAGARRGKTVFQIPNQVVREQIYGYLTQTYRENDLALEERQRILLMENMAFDGEWRPFFDYIALTLRRFSSQRDRQKGEAYVHGFTLAQTCLNNIYLPHSELDAGVDGGYADIYLQPLIDIYPDIQHSYLIELKYLTSKATDAEVTAARNKAVKQLTRYSLSVGVTRTVGHTKLHRLILLWRGMELAVAEEIQG